MEFQNICVNCMREKPTGEDVCPYCGFKNSSYQSPSYYLPPLTPLEGKYVLGRSLGSGGFGITYIARHIDLESNVVIKELYLKNISLRNESGEVYVTPRNEAFFEENKKRFQKEAKVLSRLNEKDEEGIVTVKDYFEENNTAYFVMEYLKGETLRERVKRGPLPLNEMKDLLEPIVHALIKVHQFQIVHLDITPSNIMILEDGRAKLLDFGGARVIGEENKSRQLAVTRGYAAPEQYQRNGKIGAWTDVYAMAATMVYCLTGKHPLDAMERQAGNDGLNASLAREKLPRYAKNALNTALSLKPEERYQSMEDLWGALNAQKGRGRKRAGIVMTIVLILLLGGGVAALARFHPWQQEIFVKEEEEEETRLTDRAETTTERQETETSVPEKEETASQLQDDGTTEGLGTVETLSEQEEEGKPEPQMGEKIYVEPGTYIFENRKNPDCILGVSGNFGDDGARLILTDYVEKNCNRMSVIKETEDSDVYQLRATHTNSLIWAGKSEEAIYQSAEEKEGDNGNWSLVYCGYDETKDMDIVILQNETGLVMAPKEKKTETGTEVVSSELDLSDYTQQWYLRWSEKDETEAAVPVYHEGEMVENISGVFNIASALDGITYMSISDDPECHEEPTVVLFPSTWLTEEDREFSFEFVPEREESRYRIYPSWQKEEGEHQCLEYNPDTIEIVMREEESENKNQLFRLIYAGYNLYLIQTSDEKVLGFDVDENALDENGKVIGPAILARNYDDLEDSRLEKWLLKEMNKSGEE